MKIKKEKPIREILSIKKKVIGKDIPHKVKKGYTTPGYIRLLVYFSYFYFGIRFIFSLFFFFISEVKELFGLFNLVFNLTATLFGLFLVYNLMKLKRWALTWLIILIILNVVSVLYLGYEFDTSKIPVVQIVYLAFLLGGYKHLKEEKNELKK